MTPHERMCWRVSLSPSDSRVVLLSLRCALGSWSWRLWTSHQASLAPSFLTELDHGEVPAGARWGSSRCSFLWTPCPAEWSTISYWLHFFSVLTFSFFLQLSSQILRWLPPRSRRFPQVANLRGLHSSLLASLTSACIFITLSLVTPSESVISSLLVPDSKMTE